jgi:hypothetical protein
MYTRMLLQVHYIGICTPTNDNSNKRQLHDAGSECSHRTLRLNLINECGITTVFLFE